MSDKKDPLLRPPSLARRALSRLKGRSKPPSWADYAQWARLNAELAASDRDRIRKQVAAMASPPIFGLVLVANSEAKDGLAQTLRSLQSQLYPHWELLVSDSDGLDPRMRTDRLSAGFVGWIGEGDELSEHALYAVALALKERPDAALLYTDEDALMGDGSLARPLFKPDWDPYLALATHYVGRLSLFRADLAGSAPRDLNEWDLTLRVAEQVQERQIVHIPMALYHRRVAKAPEAEKIEIVREALCRRGEAAEATKNSEAGAVRVTFRLPKSVPTVSALIPTKDRVDLLSKCLETLFGITDYPDFEVLVIDNGSQEPESLRYLKSLVDEGRARVLRDEGTFNFSRLNNRAAREARGSILALLNNDVEIVEADWMSRLAGYAVRPDVGAVGPRLLYPSGAVQHGGVVVGFGGIAAHAHLGIDRDDPGYMGRAALDQTVSAATGACLLVRKALYEQVGGLDERLAISYNDVDFCLKLREAGLRNIYMGTVTCLHAESKSRGYEDTPEKRARLASEASLMASKWEGKLLDPYYSPNLDLEFRTFGLAATSRAPKPW